VEAPDESNNEEVCDFFIPSSLDKVIENPNVINMS
jgi:hypothetical protein